MTEIATKMEEDDSETYTEVEDTEAEAFASTEHNDQNQLCRVCANTNDYLIPIFEGEGLEHELQMKIDKHLPIKVEESDSLPVQMCYQCATTLIAWHDMVQGCIEADKRLKALLQENAAPPDTKKEINEIIEPQGLADDESSNGFNDGDDDDSVEAVPGTSQEAHTTEVAHEEISTPNDRSESADAFREENTTDEGDTSRYDENDSEENDWITQEGVSKDQSTLTLYACSICNKNDMDFKSFMLHLKTHSSYEKLTAVRKVNASKSKHNLSDQMGMTAFGFKVQTRGNAGTNLYQCLICKEKDLAMSELKEHAKSHSQDGTYSNDGLACGICKRKFAHRANLRVHLKIHLDKRDLHCQYCSRKFNTIEGLELHEINHVDGEYLCEPCQKNFPSKLLALKHLINCHTQLDTCAICKEDFKTLRALKLHLLGHARSINSGKSEDFLCDLCGKSYDSQLGLNRHILLSHSEKERFICDVCNWVAPNALSLKTHLARHSLKLLPCNICGEVYNTKAKLLMHMTTKHSQKHKCQICPAQFKRAHHMAMHEQEHRELQHYTMRCGQCDMVFTEKDALRGHLKFHAKSSPYKCSKCNLSFMSSASLAFHMKKTHVRPRETIKSSPAKEYMHFKCGECKATFKYIEGLVSHAKIHTQSPVFKPFECDACDESFISKIHLQNHMRIHEPPQPMLAGHENSSIPVHATKTEHVDALSDSEHIEPKDSFPIEMEETIDVKPVFEMHPDVFVEGH